MKSIVTPTLSKSFTKKSQVEYPNFDNAIQHAVHSNEIPIPKFESLTFKELVEDVHKNIFISFEESEIKLKVIRKS